MNILVSQSRFIQSYARVDVSSRNWHDAVIAAGRLCGRKLLSNFSNFTLYKQVSEDRAKELNEKLQRLIAILSAWREACRRAGQLTVRE